METLDKPEPLARGELSALSKGAAKGNKSCLAMISKLGSSPSVQSLINRDALLALPFFLSHAIKDANGGTSMCNVTVVKTTVPAASLHQIQPPLHRKKTTQ